jgi:hypothetical protein
VIVAVNSAMGITDPLSATMTALSVMGISDCLLSVLSLCIRSCNATTTSAGEGDQFDYVIFFSTFNAAMDDYEDLKLMCVRFRALIIGRPNAGKTTILRRIAQAADGRVSLLSIISVEC